MTIPDTARLDCVTYFKLRRDAVIARYRSTEAGRKYLNKCWVYEQTKPDRKTLRETFAKGGN
ncbi:MAG: hypothetical protein Q4G33_07520 [bacterium]|nr:hypothetical protein [bacterium]